MMDLDAAFTVLRKDAATLMRLESDRLELSSLPLPAGQKDERDRDLKDQIERQRALARKTLEEVVKYPPHHTRHWQLLQQFHGQAPFDRSVFVMTKFPAPGAPTPADQQLNAVIQAVRAAVQQRGYVARVASDAQYQPILWDNVELYLLGCQRGIAIVEDKYFPELNPNVAMEWGWMRGMGRNVLYLVENSFQRQRADWGGLIEARFDWANPGPDIANAVAAWLQ
jgi:hypothetical protein